MFVTHAYIKCISLAKRGQLAGGLDILEHKQAPEVSISVYQQIRLRRNNLHSFQLAEQGLFLFSCNCWNDFLCYILLNINETIGTPSWQTLRTQYNS